MANIRVIVVDDSAICLERLRFAIEADGDMQVVGTARGAAGVVELAQRHHPDVLVTDLIMPEADGLSVVRSVMRAHPVPIVVVSAGGLPEVSAFDAVRLGALEVATKPPFGDKAAEHALRATVRRVHGVPVVRHPGVRSTPAPRGNPLPNPWRGPAVTALAIGASAGGPPAIVELLSALPVHFPRPILVAQHMPPHHAATFAQFLAQRCPFKVQVAKGVAALKPGQVVIPDDGKDLVFLDAQRVASVAATTALTPSVDALLTSAAKYLGPRGAGVVLSGIGDDGARGLSALRAAGGLTFAQEERSCAVYGMPLAAAPAACAVLSAAEIARAVAQSTGKLGSS